MIVYEGEGSLFSTKLQTIVCPVNTRKVMGNGLALAFKQKVRGLFEFYKGVCGDKTLTVGHTVLYKIPNSKHQVLLFPTKDFWGHPSKLEWIEEGLIELVKNYKEWGITEIGFPPLGCGYGQLDYIKHVRPLFVKHLTDIDLQVHIYLYDRKL